MTLYDHLPICPKCYRRTRVSKLEENRYICKTCNRILTEAEVQRWENCNRKNNKQWERSI